MCVLNDIIVKAMSFHIKPGFHLQRIYIRVRGKITHDVSKVCEDNNYSVLLSVGAVFMLPLTRVSMGKKHVFQLLKIRHTSLNPG
jgi:hypothetical protein